MGIIGTAMAGAADRAMESYLACIRTTMDAALCLRNFASEQVERHNKPEVECSSGKDITTQGEDGLGNLVLPPMVIHKGSVNAVRVSIAVQQKDDVEKMIARKFMQFMMRRAEAFQVLRKVPMPGYDISLLITNFHLQKLVKVKVIEFVCEFISDIYADIMEIKLALNTRGRSVATS